MPDSATPAPTVDATGASTGQNGGLSATSASVSQAPAIAFATDAEFQERVESILKERLKRADDKAAAATAKAKADAEAAAAAKNGEWVRADLVCSHRR